MANIQAINFPFIGDAITLKVLVNTFETTSQTTSLQWYLITATGSVCLTGVYEMTESEFDNWGQDNSYLDNLVASSIPVIII
jgi:hypothetical protein